MIFPQRLHTFDNSDTSFHATITADSTAHTKGAWTEIYAAIPFDSYWIEIAVDATQATTVDTSMLLDIGVDDAGGTSYVVKIADMQVGFLEVDAPCRWQFPLFIPAGSTVAARCQSAVTSDTASLSAILYGGTPPGNPFPIQGPVVTYGANEGTSHGVVLLNSTQETRGAWAEIVSATTHPHRGFTVSIQGADAVLANADFLLDIGVGAASSEVAVVENIQGFQQGAEQMQIFGSMFFLQPLVEGVRVVARAQGAGNNQQNNIAVVVHGWG